jgi:hypothetical protein
LRRLRMDKPSDMAFILYLKHKYILNMFYSQ